MHHPARPDSKFVSLEHHLSCDNACINIAAELSIVRPLPAFVLVIADDKNKDWESDWDKFLDEINGGDDGGKA